MINVQSYVVFKPTCMSDIVIMDVYIQWSIYFKTTNGTMKLWSYTAGSLKIKVQ